jgi:hypothetical protein
MSDDGTEVVLPGGFTNAGLVRRVGPSVRRPWRPAGPAARPLLDHLARAGFDGAPRFLGVDDQGREMLSFIPARRPSSPFPPWALTDEALVSVAALLRRFHEAVASFDPSRYVWPQPVPRHFATGRSATTTPTSTM